MNWDDDSILRWLEPLGGREGDLAEVFAETLTETCLEWRDGEVREARVRREQGTSARWRRNVPGWKGRAAVRRSPGASNEPEISQA